MRRERCDTPFCCCPARSAHWPLSPNLLTRLCSDRSPSGRKYWYTSYTNRQRVLEPTSTSHAGGAAPLKNILDYTDERDYTDRLMNAITLIDWWTRLHWSTNETRLHWSTDERDYTDRLMNAITLIDWWTRLHWSTNERDYTDRLMNTITLID